MPAVDTSNSINQCDLLNKAAFPKLWFDTTELDTTAIPLIASGGILKTYSSQISTYSGSINTILKADAILTNSPLTLIKFLSGGGIGNTDTFVIDYSQFKNVVLTSIVETYFTPQVNSYTYSTPAAPLIADSKFWTNGDDIAANPNSILGRMLNAGLLLKSSDLYAPGSKTSLLYLLNLEAGKRSTEQNTRILELEARNLKFMGAWLAEYCFYRCRYEWLLKKFFAVYTTPPSGVGAYTSPSPKVIGSLFAGSGSAANQYSGQSSSYSVSQQEYINCMVYHLACLNTRMVDMRRLLGKIGIYYTAVQTQIQASINNANEAGSNTDLIKKITTLNNSADTTQKYLTKQDFHKGVMEYNLEKNRYSNILLSFYAFLNIVAVAVIVKVNSS